MEDEKQLDFYAKELLHINEVDKNRLVDLNQANDTFILENDDETLEQTIHTIVDKYGKIGSILLEKSAISDNEQLLTPVGGISYKWSTSNGKTDAKLLHSIIEDQHDTINLKGTNPLFLSIGSLSYNCTLSSKTKETKLIECPILIFPILLTRGGLTAPITVELIEDDVFLNPCLFYRLELEFGNIINKEKQPPIPNFTTSALTGNEQEIVNYFLQLESYFYSLNLGEKSGLKFDAKRLCISRYEHTDLCMYYDIVQNRDRFINNPIVKSIFEGKQEINNKPNMFTLMNVLESDSIQDEIIKTVDKGESIIIKGPPGTGKTVTITNIIADALANNKTVLVSSEKATAMAEVFAKMPKNIRKYMLLLQSESEAKASRIKTSSIKKELSKVVNESKAFQAPSNISSQLSNLNSNIFDTKAGIKFYQEFVFGNRNIFEYSLYDALNQFYKYKTDEELKRFNPQLTKGLNNLSLLNLFDIVDKISALYKDITLDYAYQYKYNPYLDTAKVNIQIILAAFKEMQIAINEIKDFYDNLESDYQGIFTHFTYNDLLDILSKEVNNDIIDKVYDTKISKEKYKELSTKMKLLEAYDFNYFSKFLYSFREIEKQEAYKLLEVDDTYLDLSVTTARGISKAIKLFQERKLKLNEKECEQLKDVIENISRIYKEESEAKYNIHSVIKELNPKEEKVFEKACKALEKYLDKDPSTIKGLDFKAKGAFKTIKKLSFLNNVELNTALEVVKVQKGYISLKNEANKYLDIAMKILHGNITFEDLNALHPYMKIVCRPSFKDEMRYYIEVNRIYEELIKISALFKDVITCRDAYRLIDAIDSYNEIKLDLFNIYEFEEGFDPYLAYQYIVLKHEFPEISKERLYSFDQIKNKEKFIVPARKVASMIEELKQFEVSNYYTSKEKLLLNDLFAFNVLSQDQKFYSKVNEFMYYLDSIDSVFELKDHVDDYEERVKDKINNPFNLVFKHTLFKNAIDDYLSDAETTLFTLSENYVTDLNKYAALKNNLQSLNATIIEKQLAKSVSEDERDHLFDFLQHELDKSSIRYLFKKQAEDIVRIKRCVIASPSTISVLLRENKLNFDLAIVDEASQLHPVEIVPIAGRSKQIVIVGDQWQMPPIDHGKQASIIEKNVNNSDIPLESSLFSLAIRNNAFDIFEFRAHYRSRTESLIKFSQEEFYEKMITFPAANPKGENLGFFDYYIEDGRVIGGVNEKEAEQVVKCMRKHFDKYYDPEKKILKESLGIITFGEKQLNAVKRLVNKDSELSDKIAFALSNLQENQTEDKVLFYRPIESAQGQEADHLILSVTYGRGPNGTPTDSYGELNRGQLGRCIFNVAVSRARSSISVVHSTKPFDIKDNEKEVKYIKRYLQIVEMFAKDDANQFLSFKEENYFIDEIKNELINLGIPEDRLIENYGNTKGSARIPLAILSEDHTYALAGLWLEKEPYNNFDFIDYNALFYNILANYNWKLTRINILDWYLDKAKTIKLLTSLVANL